MKSLPRVARMSAKTALTRGSLSGLSVCDGRHGRASHDLANGRVGLACVSDAMGTGRDASMAVGCVLHYCFTRWAGGAGVGCYPRLLDFCLENVS